MSPEPKFLSPFKKSKWEERTIEVVRGNPALPMARAQWEKTLQSVYSSEERPKEPLFPFGEDSILNTLPSGVLRQEILPHLDLEDLLNFCSLNRMCYQIKHEESSLIKKKIAEVINQETQKLLKDTPEVSENLLKFLMKVFYVFLEDFEKAKEFFSKINPNSLGRMPAWEDLSFLVREKFKEHLDEQAMLIAIEKLLATNLEVNASLINTFKFYVSYEIVKARCAKNPNLVFYQAKKFFNLHETVLDNYKAPLATAYLGAAFPYAHTFKEQFACFLKAEAIINNISNKNKKVSEKISLVFFFLGKILETATEEEWAEVIKHVEKTLKFIDRYNFKDIILNYAKERYALAKTVDAINVIKAKINKLIEVFLDSKDQDKTKAELNTISAVYAWGYIQNIEEKLAILRDIVPSPIWTGYLTKHGLETARNLNELQQLFSGIVAIYNKEGMCLERSNRKTFIMQYAKVAFEKTERLEECLTVLENIKQQIAFLSNYYWDTFKVWQVSIGYYAASCLTQGRPLKDSVVILDNMQFLMKEQFSNCKNSTAASIDEHFKMVEYICNITKAGVMDAIRSLAGKGFSLNLIKSLIIEEEQPSPKTLII